MEDVCQHGPGREVGADRSAGIGGTTGEENNGILPYMGYEGTTWLRGVAMRCDSRATPVCLWRWSQALSSGTMAEVQLFSFLWVARSGSTGRSGRSGREKARTIWSGVDGVDRL